MDDRRLIEDYLPIEEISKEASREKSVRKGHISTLHLWWARRPLVACRAAVYGALVPADRWVPEVDLKNPPADAAKAEKMVNGAKRGLNRRAAGKFVAELCKYPGDPRKIDEARRHILEAHRDRLVAENEALNHRLEAGATPKPPVLDKSGQPITKDTPLDQVPPPKVLDMFAGGGAIPLEALRLGCEAYALDLNPVAHIIQLCTLVYPQKYGKPDPSARGMTGPKNAQGETTWGGLADEVRYWGNWVLEKVRAEIGDLYPPIPDPQAKPEEIGADPQQHMDFAKDKQGRLAVPRGYLTPVAYLWTRTVKCKNPSCGATVPLVKQTWLCKKDKRYVAMNLVALKGRKQVRFEVVESQTAKGLGFDPEAFSKGGNATCPFCGTVADSDYVKAEGCGQRMSTQLMAVACARPRSQGKVYLPAEKVPDGAHDENVIRARIADLCRRTGLDVPHEMLVDDAKNSFWIRLYGFTTYGHLFTPRQMLALLSFCAAVREAANAANTGHVKATVTLLAAMVDKLADFGSTQCTWNYTGGRGVRNSFTRQAIPMAWDFAETNPFNPAGASWIAILEDIPAAIEMLMNTGLPGEVERRSATTISRMDESLDAVITDPPYYDNVSYADLSDFFFVWLKRSVGHLHPEHFSGQGTPKKNEAVSDAARHGGNRTGAKAAYEDMMSHAFAEAVRVLKPGGIITIVYAHKTTLGWSTLVDALRRSGCEVVEAWPLDTERGVRMIAMGTAALASSIFLVARKRGSAAAVGNYEDDVRPELEQIVRERVETLWEMGIAGADLVIAAVGAGLRAFTKYARVEFANGEEVPAERFLTEVEGVVLDTILRRLSKEAGGNGGKMTLAGVDEPTRFYVLWRYAYKAATLDAGEAIIFANGTHVELDGQRGLSAAAGSPAAKSGRALVEKAKSKYRLRDFTERGKDEKLGQRTEDGKPAALIDVLHRVLWLVENRPRELTGYLEDVRPDRERLRLVAQALAGTALKGSGSTSGLGGAAEGSDSSKAGTVGTTPAESAALNKLTANWRSLIEQPLAAGESGLFGGR
ncbi:MAG: DUF1156 domain-containing protein [Phycisphaerae bacterium]|nr:DUF1156 domain-containing protein [Phycisphaerae bacterium]